MPRKTKDSKNEEIETKDSKVKKASKTATTKKTTKTKKASSTSKLSTAKKSTTAKKTAKKTSVAKKETSTKKAPATKKLSTKKTPETKKKVSTTAKTEAKKATKSKSKVETRKAATTKKTTTKKVTTKKASTSKVKKEVVKKTETVEYYDLPYRYNQTIVKILAQTPTNLFIYWDISDEDRENYRKQYGDNFFETTKPILKIYNDTLHYDFEVEINDFANCWYLHVNDSKCDYRVELGRRPNGFQLNQDSKYFYISSSNEIESPNDKILFNTLEKMIYFRNTKTNATRSKSVANLSFIRNMGKIYNIYDLYKELYKDEDINNFSNPSSGIF